MKQLLHLRFLCRQLLQGRFLVSLQLRIGFFWRGRLEM
jgi:hypothetical protein